jgi:hypothetical protein
MNRSIPRHSPRPKIKKRPNVTLNGPNYLNPFNPILKRTRKYLPLTTIPEEIKSRPLRSRKNVNRIREPRPRSRSKKLQSMHTNKIDIVSKCRRIIHDAENRQNRENRGNRSISRNRSNWTNKWRTKINKNNLNNLNRQNRQSRSSAPNRSPYAHHKQRINSDQIKQIVASYKR